MLEGLNYNDIASILNMSVKSVDNAIQRIKNKVRNTLLVEE
jgi:DNA-directed RNA polymerase specialized sigma24 family protein